MPRRTKPYIGPGKMLGGRVTEEDIATVRQELAAYIEKFDELTQLEDRKQFVQDLVHECAWTQSMSLDYLVRGTRTKPDEWTTQILVRGLATVMQRHGLKPAISESFDKNHNKRQSLYLRLIPGVIRIAGFPVPKYVKGVALRAMRINHEGVIRDPNQAMSKEQAESSD